MSCYSTFTLEGRSDEWLQAAREYVGVRYEQQSDGCWKWLGQVSGGGYGQARIHDIYVAAHRLSYELAIGAVGERLVLDQNLCRNRACINPEHLEPVTQATNLRRGLVGRKNAAKTRCPYDHEYTPANTYVIPATGSRTCRTCAMRRRREYERRQRAA